MIRRFLNDLDKNRWKMNGYWVSIIDILAFIGVINSLIILIYVLLRGA